MFETRQRLRFFDEPIQSPLISVGVLTTRNRLNLVILDTPRDIYRQVLLDGDALIEVYIVGEISNSETALAENSVDLVPVKAIAVW